MTSITVSRWLFGTLLTARYSTSSESAFEEDLARLGELSTSGPDGFASVLDGTLAERISGDFWSHTLVGLLETQKRRAPGALAFRAAQIVLGARALFSDQSLQNLYTSSPKAKRAASESHHLFPKAWLASQGIKERRRVNQVANLADVGWYENNLIGADPPAVYVPRVRNALAIDDARWGRMCAEHALPPDWHLLDYDGFLRARRSRMADLTRVAFRQLGGEADAAPVMPPWFLPGADVVWGRIAETERALRGVVRDVFVARHGDAAATRIEAAIPEGARGALQHALRSRPTGADPTSIVDYLYLAQLPPLLFSSDLWESARKRLGGSPEARQRLAGAVQTIAPIRNEIAHVREVATERLKKADVACDDILQMIRSGHGSA